MTEESLEAVIEASAKILAQTAQLTFEHSEPRIKERVFSSHDVSTLVGISGDQEGTIIICFAYETAIQLAGRFMEVVGAEPATEFTGEASSALAELVNTIMGHYMIAMEARGFKVNITPVTVVTGDRVNFGVDGIKRVLAVPINLPNGPAEINIAMK